MSTNCADGHYRTTRALMMAAFDRLPAPVRSELAAAVDNFVPQPLVTAMRRKNASAAELCRQVRRWNAIELQDRAEQARRCIGPYKGNVP